MNIIKKLKIKNQKWLTLTMLAVVTVSCNGIYDNIEKYAADELIYADGLDGIIRVQVGYERVEIDLLLAGRMPASRINMKRATKTVIECADFDEPGNRRVIDSICSWVNITGLTQLKTYHLTIYTEDDFGHRSLPFETEVVPYTKENLDALELLPPSILESTSAALVEWRDRISALTHTVYRHSYSYFDKDGTQRTGSEKGDMPSFFVENVEKGINIPIAMTCRIIPRTMENGIYTPILDTVTWSTTLGLRISENAEAAIFLKTPVTVIDIDLNQAEDVFPINFSWVKVSEANGYTLKFSEDPEFPTNATYTVEASDADEYLMDITKGLELVNFFPKSRQLRLHWTVAPTTQSAPVRNQRRTINVNRTPDLVGRWLFNNEANLAVATTGQDLAMIGSGFTSVSGPSPNNKAVRITHGSHLKAVHGLPDGTDDYTIMIHVKRANTNYQLIQMNPENTDDAELIVNTNAPPTISGITAPTNHYVLAIDAWHQIVMVSQGIAKIIYIDGQRAGGGNSNDTRYFLNSEGILFFTGSSSGQSIDVAEIAIWDMALTEEEIHEASGLKRLSQSDLSIPVNTSTGSASVNNLINNDAAGTAWNNSGISQPYYAVIDMGQQRNIGRVIIYGPNQGATMPRTIQLLAAMGATPPSYDAAGWTQAGEIVRSTQAPNTTSGNMFTWDFTETTITARYLQIYMPDRWGEHVNLNQVFVYEKVSN